MSVSFNCEEVYSLLDAYHDGELSGVEESGVASHLGSCAKCHKHLEEIEGVVKSLQNVPRLNIPNDLTADLAFLNRALAAIEEAPTAQETKAASEQTKSEKVTPISEKSTIKPARPISIAAPVTVAAIAAAAAIALFVTIPRMLKTPLSNGSTVANHNETHTKDTPKTVQPEREVAVIQPSTNNFSEKPNQNETSTQPSNHTHSNAIEKDPLIAEYTPAMSVPHKLDENLTTPDNNASKTGDVTSSNEDSTTGVTAENAIPTDHEIATANAQSPDGPDIVALYPSDSNNTPTEDLAIPTDEDGLYAIKL